MLKNILLKLYGHSEEEEEAKIAATKAKIEARERQRREATRKALDEEYSAYIRGHRDT